MSITLTHRKLRPDEAAFLTEQIKLTPNITGYSQQEWQEFKQNQILVAENKQGEIVGVCLYYDFSDIWVYLAVLFVLPEFRGKGVGKELFYQACSEIKSRKKNSYVATKTPAVKKMMKDLNFTMFDTLFKLPEPYKKYEGEFLRRSVKWALNSYRIQEIIRKALVFEKESDFLYGIKAYHQ